MNAALSAQPVTTNADTVGTYFCYQADSGRWGRLQITGWDPDSKQLTGTYLTWGE